ncbi:hypothetical protein [Hymenobacter wooponensis]|uniref:hypothetical protein n=1 Tax=Hymenobacter wooponensis TaxID=1525360 RepID=UPI001436917F|nr:hypothetical protein [Hymenobacter wooponensis]
MKSAQAGYLKINTRLAEFERSAGQLLEQAERENTEFTPGATAPLTQTESKEK